MDHTQFEMQIAAILAAGAAGASGTKDPAAVVDLLVAIREEIANRGVIVKTSANFIPKGR
jgi:hypothetical protein